MLVYYGQRSLGTGCDTHREGNHKLRPTLTPKSEYICRPLTHSEVKEFTEAKDMDTILNFMRAAEPDALPAGSVPSFQAGQLLPGDALFLPMVAVYLEKAINANSITLKATWSSKGKESRQGSSLCHGHLF